MTDLWPSFSSNQTEKNNAIAILREQARALETKTEKKVKATFSKIAYQDGLAGAYAAMSQLSVSIPGLMNKEIVDEALKGKKDIAELYKITNYKFEIYNDTYRFRLFMLNYREFFPIELITDEGIKSDIKCCTELVAHSNSELESMIEAIFSSEKVKTVIHHMMEASN